MNLDWPSAQVLLVLSPVLALAGYLMLARVVRFWKNARAYALAMGECGRIGPPPTDKAHARMMRVAQFFVKHCVGKVEVIGYEKLASLPSPFILAANHGSLFDVAIVPVLLNSKARYPAAQGVMRALGGLPAYFMASWGVFAVDQNNGKKAFQAMVKVLCSGDGADIIAIFPEAQTNMDGRVGPFKTGTVRIAKLASDQLGKPVPILPAYIRYGRYPGPWISKLSFANQWLFALVMSWYYGRGARVVIGEAIMASELPACPREASEILKERIVALDPKAV